MSKIWLYFQNTDSQLTKYFGLRKRKYSDFNENEMKHLGKRLRKDVKISDAECAQSKFFCFFSSSRLCV